MLLPFYFLDVKWELSCNVCGRIFKSIDWLRAHKDKNMCSSSNLSKKDPATKITCEHCGSKFGAINSYSKHMKSQHNIELPMVKCTLCNSRVLEMNLDNHIKIAHMPSYEETFQCEFCNYVVRVSQFQWHMKRNHKAKMDIQKNCEICDQKYLDSDLLKYHMARVHEIDTYVLEELRCSLCSIVLLDKVGLKSHIQLVHEKQTQFNCEKCGLGFTTNGNLERHDRLRHLERLKCPLCKDTFAFGSKLDAHVANIHPYQKPFPCSYCDMTFSTWSGPRRHERVHLGGTEKIAQCETCGKVFSHRQYLKQHYLNLQKKGVAHGDPNSIQNTPKKQRLVNPSLNTSETRKKQVGSSCPGSKGNNDENKESCGVPTPAEELDAAIAAIESIEQVEEPGESEG